MAPMNVVTTQKRFRARVLTMMFWFRYGFTKGLLIGAPRKIKKEYNASLDEGEIFLILPSP